MHALLEALPDSSALLVVRRHRPAPSVGPGQVLADVIQSEAISVVRLTEVFRQAAESRIPKRFGFDPIRDVQVLCPMNRGGVRAHSLNIELQATLNPATEQKVEGFGWHFAPGEKVIQIKTDYDKEVYNYNVG